jgi:hypothetical protein
MVPWTDHSAPEGWVVVPPKETELALTSSMRAVIPVKPVTMRASKLTINPILVMACGCSSSVFIVPLHDSVRTSALAGSKAQINAEVTNSDRDMATHAAQVPPHCWLTNRRSVCQRVHDGRPGPRRLALPSTRSRGRLIGRPLAPYANAPCRTTAIFLDEDGCGGEMPCTSGSDICRSCRVVTRWAASGANGRDAPNFGVIACVRFSSRPP